MQRLPPGDECSLQSSYPVLQIPLLPSQSQRMLVTAWVCCGIAIGSLGDDFAFLHSLGQLHTCSWIVFAGPGEAVVLDGGYKDKLEPWEC